MKTNNGRNGGVGKQGLGAPKCGGRGRECDES